MNDDPKKHALEPQLDLLQFVEVPDKVLNFYLSLARAAGMVYAVVVTQLINMMYRDQDYLERRRLEHRRTAYDLAKERDLQALAWLIHAAALYIPEEIRRIPPLPLPPKPRRKTPKANKARRDAAAPPE